MFLDALLLPETCIAAKVAPLERDLLFFLTAFHRNLSFLWYFSSVLETEGSFPTNLLVNTFPIILCSYIKLT
jgi:hypothetical protein